MFRRLHRQSSPCHSLFTAAPGAPSFFSSLSTLNLLPLPLQRFPTYLLCFLSLPNCFALTKNASLLFSVKSKLFFKITRGGVCPFPLQKDQNETSNRKLCFTLSPLQP